MVHRSLPDWVDYVVNWLSSRGIGGLHPTPGTLGCPKPSGRLHGRSLGPLKLGFTRSRARQTLPRFGVTYNNMDNFCLFGGWGIRAGYPSAKLERHLRPSLRRRVDGRVILALTANPYYALNGVRPGIRLVAARRRVHVGKRFHIGRNYWYVVPGRVSNGLLKVRGGIVQEVGIIDRQLSRDRAAQSRLLTSFTAA
jgi:hypothetical protein